MLSWKDTYEMDITIALVFRFQLSVDTHSVLEPSQEDRVLPVLICCFFI